MTSAIPPMACVYFKIVRFVVTLGNQPVKTTAADTSCDYKPGGAQEQLCRKDLLEGPGIHTIHATKLYFALAAVQACRLNAQNILKCIRCTAGVSVSKGIQLMCQ